MTATQPHRSGPAPTPPPAAVPNVHHPWVGLRPDSPKLHPNRRVRYGAPPPPQPIPTPNHRTPPSPLEGEGRGGGATPSATKCRPLPRAGAPTADVGTLWLNPSPRSSAAQRRTAPSPWEGGRSPAGFALNSGANFEIMQRKALSNFRFLFGNSLPLLNSCNRERTLTTSEEWSRQRWASLKISNCSETVTILELN